MKELFWKYSLIAMILGLGVILFIEFIPFFSGILGALTIYILLRKQMIYFTDKKKMRRSLMATLLIGETILCFLIPLSLVVWLVINTIQNVNLDPNLIIKEVEHLADLISQRTGYNLLQKENLRSVVSTIPYIGQSLMGNITSFTINLFVLVFVLYFMLIGGRKMETYIYEILPFNEENKKSVLEEINVIVTSNAIGIPFLAIIQGIVAMIGYYFTGVPNPVFFGVLTCFATIIPIFGTALIWFPLVIYLMIVHHWVNAMILAAFALIVITNVDNLARFILQKKIADIHPLITIFGVVIGLSLFGFMGVIFGPLLISIFLLCLNIFKKEYLDDKVPIIIEPDSTEKSHSGN